ncbi:Imm1 family immunity protein [Nonomuraea sp. NPDC049421]|uniref:Imm1 family immunity protein n=1 Tax=Nonomuraea sp. NPDC049421 TaxID=3155275 RepID=UPI00343CAF71
MKKPRAVARYLSEHSKEPMLLSTSQDADTLIDALASAPIDRNLAQIHSLERQSLSSGTPDHELLVGIDSLLAVGILAFMDDEHGNLVTAGPSETRSEPIYCIMGHATEFPAHSEIAIDQVRLALKEFISSGGQCPTSVIWKTAEFT